VSIALCVVAVALLFFASVAGAGEAEHGRRISRFTVALFVSAGLCAFGALALWRGWL
jgi:multisubunit Na+/H+ antiporter MnhB subunit